MMDRPTFRKPKLYFDTSAHPSHVTFDDGKEQRRNIPWHDYVEARWDYAEPDVIRVEIGGCVVVIRGHNLAQVFQAIEDHALTRLKAQPELEQDREHEADSFATEIRFLKSPPRGMNGNGPGQIEFNLGGSGT
jgi:hypothetical protein